MDRDSAARRAEMLALLDQISAEAAAEFLEFVLALRVGRSGRRENEVAPARAPAQPAVSGRIDA